MLFQSGFNWVFSGMGRCPMLIYVTHFGVFIEQWFENTLETLANPNTDIQKINTLTAYSDLDSIEMNLLGCL